MCLVSQLWSQRFKPGIHPIRINLLVSTLILLACASPASVPLSWTILSLLHHYLRIEAGACLRTCNPHISTFGTCVTTSLRCGNIFLNISLSLSLSLYLSLSLFLSDNPHKHLRQQERPKCKPKRRSILYKHKSPDSSSLVKDPGGPVRPTRRRGFPRHRFGEPDVKNAKRGWPELRVLETLMIV